MRKDIDTTLCYASILIGAFLLTRAFNNWLVGLGAALIAFAFKK